VSQNGHEIFQSENHLIINASATLALHIEENIQSFHFSIFRYPKRSGQFESVTINGQEVQMTPKNKTFYSLEWEQTKRTSLYYEANKIVLQILNKNQTHP
jgi:hypothetical protein